jgi:hypothetical protein
MQFRQHREVDVHLMPQTHATAIIGTQTTQNYIRNHENCCICNKKRCILHCGGAKFGQTYMHRTHQAKQAYEAAIVKAPIT